MLGVASLRRAVGARAAPRCAARGRRSAEAARRLRGAAAHGTAPRREEREESRCRGAGSAGWWRWSRAPRPPGARVARSDVRTPAAPMREGRRRGGMVAGSIACPWKRGQLVVRREIVAGVAQVVVVHGSWPAAHGPWGSGCREFGNGRVLDCSVSQEALCRGFSGNKLRCSEPEEAIADGDESAVFHGTPFGPERFGFVQLASDCNSRFQQFILLVTPLWICAFDVAESMGPAVLFRFCVSFSFL
jgi:hypothetical protein